MTLEQCEKLKEWGLPQDTESNLFYNGKGQLFKGGKPRDWEDGFYACPDLEQLLELAVTKDASISLSLSKNGWAASTCNFDFIDAPEMDTIVDPDPKQAIYELIEKIMSQ